VFAVDGRIPVAGVIVDLNGDGVLDVATANRGSHDVSVLHGTGRGTLQPASAVSAGGEEPQALLTIDPDGDGSTELVVASAIPPRVTILRPGDDGGFEVVNRTELGPIPAAAFGAASMTDDGRDALFYGIGGGVTAMVPSDGGIGGPSLVGTFADWKIAAIGAGNLSGDDLSDLVIVDEATGELGTLTAAPEGGFTSERRGRVDVWPAPIAFADVNDDGILDVVSISDDLGISVQLGTGDGHFAPPAAQPEHSVSSPARRRSQDRASSSISDRVMRVVGEMVRKVTSFGAVAGAIEAGR
jgi:hypothetical protein